MCDLTKYERASQRRVEAAREIAEELRHDEKLHRLAMKAVFVLEDCHEALLRARHERQSATSSAPPDSSADTT